MRLLWSPPLLAQLRSSRSKSIFQIYFTATFRRLGE